MSNRPVKLVRDAQPTLEGAGVHLRRVFGFGHDADLFDPFLMMDDFRGDHPSQYSKGFPWHPHRGIETITYMIDGECDHSDSLGHVGTICAGDIQWMTAGSGIIHQEMPRGDENGRMGGFQLWANLPAAHKMRNPHYQGAAATEIPEVASEGARVKVIAGKLDETTGPAADIAVEAGYLDVALEPNATWSRVINQAHTVFAYLYEGGGNFGADSQLVEAESGRVVLFGEGDDVTVTAGANGARFLLISGKPLREPVAWRGPIVMNTDEQLETAWRELDEGTFIKHAPAGN